MEDVKKEAPPDVLVQPGERVLTKQQVQAFETTLVDASGPAQAGERIGEALADAAGTLLVSTESKLKSRKLWVTIGAIAAMLVQLPLGVSLPPAAQIVIGAVAGVYLVMQGRVDHAQVKRLQGPGA